VVGDHFYLKFWVNLTTSERNRLQSMFVRSASAVAPSKKIQLTLIESPLRAFQCA